MIDKQKSACVAICTFNRCVSLDRTLASLVRASFSSRLKWEVMIVDNNSRDDTREVVKRYREKLPVQYVFEKTQGLSFARNRAVDESKADVILFTDDDVLIDEAWPESMVSAAEKNPDAGYFGGKVLPFWPEGKPGWFRDDTLKEMGGLIVNYDLGADSRMYLESDPSPIGANMGFRRSLLQQLGPFRVDLGTSGKRRSVGEDTEMILRARKAGAAGYYVANAVCYHITEKARTTLRSSFVYGFNRGKAQVKMNAVSGAQGSYSKAGAYIFRGLYQRMIGRGDRLRLCLFHAGIHIGRIASTKMKRSFNISKI